MRLTLPIIKLHILLTRKRRLRCYRETLRAVHVREERVRDDEVDAGGEDVGDGVLGWSVGRGWRGERGEKGGGLWGRGGGDGEGHGRKRTGRMAEGRYFYGCFGEGFEGIEDGGLVGRGGDFEEGDAVDGVGHAWFVCRRLVVDVQV